MKKVLHLATVSIRGARWLISVRDEKGRVLCDKILAISDLVELVTFMNINELKSCKDIFEMYSFAGGNRLIYKW